MGRPEYGACDRCTLMSSGDCMECVEHLKKKLSAYDAFMTTFGISKVDWCEEFDGYIGRVEDDAVRQAAKDHGVPDETLRSSEAYQKLRAAFSRWAIP